MHGSDKRLLPHNALRISRGADWRLGRGNPSRLSALAAPVPRISRRRRAECAGYAAYRPGFLRLATNCAYP